MEALRDEDCEVICYACQPAHDEVTQRLAAAAHAWREVSPLSDTALADQLRADRIDILFDVAGHLADNRLLALARKPAPLQITWLAYEGTTGLAAMDYILADRYLLPPAAEPYYREKVLRMPDGYLCLRSAGRGSGDRPLAGWRAGGDHLRQLQQPDEDQRRRRPPLD